MKAASFFCRSLVRGENSKSIRFSSAALSGFPFKYLLDPRPAQLGERPRARAGLARELARRGAVHHALRDALRDAGDAEQVVGHVVVPGRRIDARSIGPLTRLFYVLRFTGNAELLQIKPGDAAELARRDVPA